MNLIDRKFKTKYMKASNKGTDKNQAMICWEGETMEVMVVGGFEQVMVVVMVMVGMFEQVVKIWRQSQKSDDEAQLVRCQWWESGSGSRDGI